MLLVLLYHQLTESHFREHLKYIADHHRVVLPGDPLPPCELSICLTFDDAYADIYTLALPLLEEMNMRAVLAVPTGLVGEPPYCSWDQLSKIALSGRFAIASHSHSHCNMARNGINAAQEILESRNILEARLCVPVNTFVYPYGRVNAAVHSQVMDQYKYAMRIGTAYNNASWECESEPLHRVVADGIYPFSKLRRTGYWAKLQWRKAFPKLGRA